jgi:hypothetical protein
VHDNVRGSFQIRMAIIRELECGEEQDSDWGNDDAEPEPAEGGWEGSSA